MSVLRYKFYFSTPMIWTQYIYVSQDVRIRNYFSKKESREIKLLKNIIGNTKK